MRKRLLTFIAACFYYSGLVKLARWWIRHSGQHLVILNYHQATGGDLLSHLRYLRRHYRILPLETALEELYITHKHANRTGRLIAPAASSARNITITDQESRRGRLIAPTADLSANRSAPEKRTPLVLAFDDGYHDNYTHAFALAQKLQIPFTIFLIPGYLESGDYFWWQEGNRLASRTHMREATVDGRTYHLDQAEERNVLAQHIFTRLCQATSVAEREAFLVAMREALEVSSSVVPEQEHALPLTWAEVREMQESGLISFGAHTMHHPILAYLADPIEMQQEVEECRAVLEQQLGHPVRAFAYPVGQLQHIGNNVIRAVQQAGYDWALTTRYGLNTPRSDPYLLRRIEVDVSQHWLVLAAEAAGLWGFFSWLRWMPAIRKALLRNVPI